MQLTVVCKVPDDKDMPEKIEEKTILKNIWSRFWQNVHFVSLQDY